MKTIEKNTILFTKDGFLIGNSIVKEKLEDNLFLIITDYGNELKLSENELRNLFTFDFDRYEIIDTEYMNYIRESHKNFTK